ncbi:hypothetical protein DV735_g4211, partial [Chaetothyriales sp. CBS 134920]
MLLDRSGPNHRPLRHDPAASASKVAAGALVVPRSAPKDIKNERLRLVRSDASSLWQTQTRRGTSKQHKSEEQEKETPVTIDQLLPGPSVLLFESTASGQPQEREAVYNPAGAPHAIDDSNAIEPVKHWVETGHWPASFATMSQNSVLQKRSRTPSYSQSVRDGDAPRAYSPAFETILLSNGVYMDELKGRSLVAESSKALCASLLKKQHPVQNRNEGRVYRDLTPLLVPSPALLSVSGVQGQSLDNIAEEISVEWSRCKTLGGPKPKPDFALGISPAAFNEEESAKLENYASFERLARFTDNIFFPFLLCEVKCGNEAINRADRQNMHSSSMAVRAIVKLLQSLGDHNDANDLNGQILVFSISHDNERVKIYGHFPILSSSGKTTTTTCYRFPVASFVLNFDGSQGWKKTADFVREVYKTFVPAHLQRIRDALAQMDDPRKRQSTTAAPSTTSGGGEEDRSHDVDHQSATSSHDPTGVFKIPDLPANKKQKGELSVLQELLAQQKAQLKVLQEQMEEQRKQNQEQLAEQRKQSQEQLTFLQQQLKHSQDQMEAQRMQHQEQMEAQRKQSQEQIEMLNQLLKRS